MYQQENITIQELFDQKLTKEKSIRALRDRAKEHILVLVGEEGRTRLYDKQLSIIRVEAARITRGSYTNITWGVLSRTFIKLDTKNSSLNNNIIGLLNSNQKEKDVAQDISNILNAQLKQDGHLD